MDDIVVVVVDVADDVNAVGIDDDDVDNRERGLGSTLPGVSLTVAFATAYELSAR